MAAGLAAAVAAAATGMPLRRPDRPGSAAAVALAAVVTPGSATNWNAAGIDTFYGIDWNWFEFCFKRGAFMRRSQVSHTTMHNERSIHLDTTVNTVCTNRRTQWVVEKA